ncbi:RNA polymerase sigma factor YlaC [Pelotomaculum schinkii]|uniref:RNA polymerase sigma factor YlaC n=1 Tax=Pelotomaculum schinkii TaxID=78350 RepID=A0A4Y7R7X7_9FIRM|nr:sigma-70 family RNA polymerase sigma factor [Pelotomaculum schinkii]TEB04876.1 RNA polymerase sigma factor YlaC [Pelotomaculum schinkii]
MTIIAALEGDDDKAFMMNLYNDYYGLVRKTVYNITHDADYAEDLTNDTFSKLIEKISLIRTLDSCKLAAYVVYTSKSVAINFIKHRDVQKKHVYFGEDLDLAKKVPSLEDNLEDRIVHQEEIEELGNAILRLPEMHKDLLYFKYILGMADAEIAGILKIAPDSVRQYLTRARRKAKELLDKEFMGKGGE